MKIIALNVESASVNELQQHFVRLHHEVTAFVLPCVDMLSSHDTELANCGIIVINLDNSRGSLQRWIERIANHSPSSKILLYSSCCEYRLVSAALKSGIGGYVLKDCETFCLINAVEALLAGGAPLSPRVSRFVLGDYLERSIAHSLSILTEREKQIFECMEEGNSYKGISLRFNISQNTVHSHVKNIYSKLNAVNKYDAFAKARDMAVA